MLSGAEALPVIVIGREDIERSGASSIAQVLSQRPEVSINNNGNTTVADGIGNTGSDFRTNATTVQLRGLPQGDRKSTRLNSITNAHPVCRLLLEKNNKKKTKT